MPISGISTDYSTRTKDIHIFQGVNATKLSSITPSFGRISNYCSGIQKLIQRYTITLLNELGSQPGFPTFGTNLVNTLLRSSSFINKADVGHIFNEANIKVIREFRVYQRGLTDVPLDEQIDTATLADVVIQNGTIGLTIKIYPLTGEPVVFIMPLPSIS